MQYIWLFLVTTSISLLLFSNHNAILTAMTTATQNAVSLCISLVGIYALWLGIINVAKNCGILQSLTDKINPFVKKLFGTNNDDISADLSLNLSANLLGIGNASTPPAIRAIKNMDDGNGKLTKGMAMLFVINACGLQIMPTTVIGMRASLGSANPTDILLPCLITSLVATVVGVLIVSFVYRGEK